MTFGERFGTDARLFNVLGLARGEPGGRSIMLSSAPITTMLPVIDMKRAQQFYESKLGLTPVGMKPYGQFVYACAGGSTIALFPKEGGTKADHTAISFKVENIGFALIALENAGVVFENYDLPGLKTVNHVCVLDSEKAAWFKDTEGNYLCIHEDLA
jgi:catechol 2,3-dioxygenase-like lactoylglutathione lyase family enzyme